MRAGEIRIKIRALGAEQKMWQDIIDKKSCNDCTQYHQGVCQHWQAEPPAEVVKAGCDEWNWDEIPF